MTKINENKLQELVASAVTTSIKDAKTSKSTKKSTKAAKIEKPQEEPAKVEKPKTKATKTKKAEVIKEVAEMNKTALVEKVVSNREVKYIYPDDVNDTLTRKAWRQKVRNKMRKLETDMLRIKDQNSKEFKSAQKAYNEYRKTVIKEAM